MNKNREEEHITFAEYRIKRKQSLSNLIGRKIVEIKENNTPYESDDADITILLDDGTKMEFTNGEGYQTQMWINDLGII